MKHIPDWFGAIVIVTLLALASLPLYASDRSRYMGPQGEPGATGKNGDDADGNSIGLAASQIDMDWDYGGYQVGAGAAYFDSSEAAVVSVGRKVCLNQCGRKMLLKGSVGASDGEVGGGVGFTLRLQ